MLNEDFSTAYSSKFAIILLVRTVSLTQFSTIVAEIRDLQTYKGLALQDILTEVHTYVHKSKFWMMPPRFHFLSLLSLQLSSHLMSAFFYWRRWPIVSLASHPDVQNDFN